MLFHKDCGVVSIRKVNFSISKKNIIKHAIGMQIYAKTKYLILNNKSQYALIKVYRQKNVFYEDRTKKLIYPVTKVEIISLPHETEYIVDDSIDVTNVVEMTKIYLSSSKRCTIVEGMFGHINFIIEPKVYSITVTDIVPPFPSKLVERLKWAIKSNIIKYPVTFKYNLIDIRNKINMCRNKCIVLSCSAVQLNSFRPDVEVVYINNFPSVQNKKVSLIGCDLTLRTFRDMYKKNPDEFISLCPYIESDAVELIRCCKIKKGFKIDNRKIIVSINASPLEIAQGINSFFKKTTHLAP